jgi:hypothetical protein
MYQLTDFGVIRLADGAAIPEDPGNVDYREYLAWRAAGNKPEPAISDLWQDIRARRASLLAASDWTQVADAPLDKAQQAAWRAYRQKLRDLPRGAADPGAVVWPEPPG